MIPTDFSRALTVDGVEVHVEIEPSCWIGDERLGILVRSALGSATLYSGRSFKRATRLDLELLIRRIAWHACAAPGCEGRFLATDRAVENPDRVCERHRLAELEAAAAEERRRLDANRARRNARAKAAGQRYLATVWIHRDDADDVYVEIYFANRPTPTQLREEAFRRGSRLLDDFSVVEL